MLTTVSIIIIGLLYGVYDFFIKQSSGKIDSTVGALICQLFSVMTIILLIIYRKIVQKSLFIKTSWQGFVNVSVAGILIGLALVSLFLFFTNRNVKAVTSFPIITSLRNITLIILGILVLKENFSFMKAIGLFFSLLGIYLLMI